MEETYEEIVKKWYVRLQGDFTNLLMEKYKNSNMRREDAENIYQDTFYAIRKNVASGRVTGDVSWRSYIIKIGLNMASKHYRKAGIIDSIDDRMPDNEEKPSTRAKRISDLISQLPERDGETDLYSDPEAQSLLGDELTHTPEPCASIIRMSYYSDMSDVEIAETLSPYRDNGKPASTNAKAVKARRWLCMRDLVYRVKLSLYMAGIIDEKPVREKRR